MSGKSGIFPSISDSLYEILTVGVIPGFYGRVPEKVGTRGLPQEARATPDIAKKLRNLIVQWDAFVCSESSLQDRGGFAPTPSRLVGKKNPDRTASVDNRLISDIGAVNRGFTKEDLFPFWVPPIAGMVEEIQRRRRRPAKMAAMLCKRDIDRPFNRIFARPDLSRLTIEEMGREIRGLSDNVMVGHLVYSFIWISRHSRCQLFGIAIQALHVSYGMGDIGRSGDRVVAIFAHLFTLRAPSVVVGGGCGIPSGRGCPDPWAIGSGGANALCMNDQSIRSRRNRKDNVERMFFLLRHLLDTETDWIFALAPEIVAAKNTISPAEFTSRNTRIRLRTLRQLRGPCVRWLNA